MLIDCHSHLHVKEFDKDRAKVIERARASSISKMINVGFDIEGNFQALALAKKYDFIYATMGIHPHLASEWSDDVGAKIFETAKKEEKIVALGEMGLDYYKNFQPAEVQKKTFCEQLALAHELNLPVIIHCRDAFADVFEILKEARMERVLMHCFTGTLEEAQEAWRMGYMMAFTGIITYPSAHELRTIAKLCPMDQFVIETDCPFLAPQCKRGQRNEPSFLKEVAEKVAEIRGKDIIQVATRIFENALRFFNVT